jgi:hypothetical protein
VGISTYQVRTWRHRREERLSIDVKAPIKVSSIPTLLTCSIEGLPESMMASNSMKRSERSGLSSSLRLVRNFLQPLRENRRPRPLVEVVPPSQAEQFSARNAVWLFIRDRKRVH